MAATNKRTKTILQSPLRRAGSLPKENYFRADPRRSPTAKASPVINFSISGFVNYGFTDASSLPFDLRDVILLDNQSTVDLFYNPDLVSNIRETDEAYDVHGNGGDLTTYKKAYIENYGDVSFDDTRSPTFSVSKCQEKFQVTYDSAGEGAFIVHKPDGVNVYFVAHPMAYITMTQ
jgi:hypothetical protein